jgi:hypothetical protein
LQGSFALPIQTHTKKNANLQKIGATSKNEIRIYSHLGLDQNLKKSIFVASTQAVASMSPSEFPPVGGKLRAVAQMAHRFCSAPRCDKFILVG